MVSRSADDPLVNPDPLFFRIRDYGVNSSVAGRINAPRARPGSREEQEDEAIQHGWLALIQGRREEMALRSMCHEIRRRHFSREYERCRPCEQSNDQQQATDEFEYAGKTDQRKQCQVVESRNVRNAKELRGGVLQKKKPGNDTQRTLSLRRPGLRKAVRRRHLGSYSRSGAFPTGEYRAPSGSGQGRRWKSFGLDVPPPTGAPMAKSAPELDRNDLMASLSRESMRLTLGVCRGCSSSRSRGPRGNRTFR